MTPIETRAHATRTGTVLGLCTCLAWLAAGCAPAPSEDPATTPGGSATTPPPTTTAPAAPARTRAASGVLPSGLTYRRLTPDEVKAHLARLEAARESAAREREAVETLDTTPHHP
jgi:hypothetical protein